MRVLVVDVLYGTLLAIIGSSVLWTLVMHLCTWTYLAGRDPSPRRTTHEPEVSVVKPTKGVDQSAYENFASFCRQEYGAAYELLFCVEEVSDPVVPVIRRLMEEHPDERIRLVFSDSADSRSFGKLKNMTAGVAASSYDVIVFSDSDARVPPTFLRDTVACMGDPSLGIAFGPPAYTGSEDWPAALTSTSVNELVLRIATLHRFGLFDGAIGTTMVTRRSVLREVGGIERLGWHIADDIQLARVIRRRGYRIHLLRQPALVIHPHDSFPGWWSHRHRWLVIIRHYWPVHYLLMHLVDLVLLWSLLLLAVTLFRGSDVPVALTSVLVALAVPSVSAVAVNTGLARNEKLVRFLWVVLVQELLRFPLFLHSLVTDEIVWRGRRFRVHPDGTASVVEPRAVGHGTA
ncbi:glycosyltransferase [Geodermatophilus marinus]|uniref:glycosyltransferase n=1 Tax=Geodermatophilus sp. LHW52908 TaxID=2303986 RepID=UPI000E3E0255|nr:glycosyltransferase [Geodermatophilus sp. LHW52908]RFU22548.1 glycosyltransferase [Geodermatophilus sp. LHW52908]